MTVIRPNSISGVTSITAHGGDITYFKSDGTGGNQFTHNIQSTGVITATKFVGPIEGNVTGSGANLTSIPAANITGTLPAISAANLTNIPAANITGTLPAIDGSNLTGVGASFGNSSVNTSGIITATAFVSTEQGSASFRNLVHNGNMYINQRNVTSSTSRGHITCDRWRTWEYAHGATATSSISDVASGTNPYKEGHRKAYKFAMSGSPTAASGSSVFMAHSIEAQTMAQCGWDFKSTSSFITAQFWVKASHAQTYQAAFQTPDAQRNYGWSFALAANTWTKVIETIPGNSNLVFDNNTDGGLDLYIFAWMGSDYDNIPTPNAWVVYDGDEYCLPHDSGWLLSSSPTFEVTGVQIEVGKVATSYEHRSPATELQLCKRYFQKDINRRMFWGSGNVSNRYFPVIFDVEMRNTPTISFHSTSLDSGSASSHNVSRQGYNFRMSGSGRFFEFAHTLNAQI